MSGIICFGLVIAAGTLRPAFPEDWRAIQKGTEREELLEQYQGKLHTGMKEIKGFDTLSHSCEQLGFRACRWTLFVYYDESDHIESVRAHFMDPRCGWRNQHLRLR